VNLVFDILLISVIAFSILSNFYGIPGNFIMAISNLFYGITTGFDSFTVAFAVSLFGLVILLEFVEFLLISFTARKYGSSKWGVFGAVIGGLVGAISGAFVTPVIGAIIGSFVGVFLGALISELIVSTNIKKGLLSGFGAFLGKLGGLSIKVIGSVTMASMILWRVI